MVNVEMLKEIRNICPRGSIRLRLVFKAKGINLLRTLWQEFHIDFKEEQTINEIVQSGSWGNLESRVVCIGGFSQRIFNNQLFQNCVVEGVKSIWLDTDQSNPLINLFAGRKAVREKFADSTIRDCIGNINEDIDLMDLGLVVEGVYAVNNGLPKLIFTLSEPDGNYHENIIVDAWSGQIITDRRDMEVYVESKSFRDVIHELVFGYMEEVTAPAV